MIEETDLYFCIVCNKVYCKSSDYCNHDVIKITHRQYIQWVLDGKPSAGDFSGKEKR